MLIKLLKQQNKLLKDIETRLEILRIFSQIYNKR